jgi:PAS domain S-box-containing protein
MDEALFLDARLMYEQVLENSRDGHFAFDCSGRYTFWNAAMERFSGFTKAEVLGKNAREVLPFLTKAGEEQLLPRILSGEKISSGEQPFAIPEKGKSGFFEAHHAPLTLPNGAVAGGFAVVRDVTAQKRAQTQLWETEARFKSMADVAPVLLWMAGTDGLCTFFNQTWLDFTGRSMEEEWGVGWAEGVHFEDFQRCMDTYTAAFNERRVFEMEYRLRRADGEYRWILDRGTPRYTGDGQFAGFIGSCIDISDLKQLESELRTAVRVRDEFLAVASHELRTPLTSLQLQLEILNRTLKLRSEETLAPNKLERNVQAAKLQSQRLTNLVNVLLDVSHIGEGKLSLEYEEIDLAALVKELTERLGQLLADSGCPLHFSARAPVKGHWDSFRLEQVVTNLLSNAAKYGGGKPIEVTVGSEAGLAQLVVKDHGIGIAPEHQARVFGRFERAVSTRNYGGFGLGLWISRQVVQALGGTISLKSAPGDGAAFTVSLPLAPPDWVATAAQVASPLLDGPAMPGRK